MTVAARASLLVTIPLLMMRGLVTHQVSAPALFRTSATAVAAPTQIVTGVQEVIVASDNTTQPNTDADSALDFYGNEVTVAVAEYQIDGVGRLYELHSPQSRLPRLGSPKS
jgi:hypothetical protein